MNFDNALSPTTDQRVALFGQDDGEPIVMANLLRFKEWATYADPQPQPITGRDAYDRYREGFAGLLAAEGGRIIYSGAVRGLLIGTCEDLWDAVALVQYPNASVFRGIIGSPVYRILERHRSAGLAGQLNITTAPW